MKIKYANFVISSTTVTKCPDPKMPEYAFIGRSNVGKSSLINSLTGFGKLAKTSGSPVKTITINHFMINNEWYLVDLPGYGYAKRSKTERSKWDKMIKTYILDRANLLTIFVLIDSRHEAQKNDLEFINWCGEKQLPIAIIFTKSDKLKAGEIQSNIAGFEKSLLEYWEELPPRFLTSSVKKNGLAEILEYINGIIS